MINSIGIIGFLIILYTAYLILTEGDKKDKEASVEEKEQEQIESNDTSIDSIKPAKRKEKNVEVILSDEDGEVLRQGRAYNEQISPEPTQYAGPTQYYEQQQSDSVTTSDDCVPTPSSKNVGEPSLEVENIEVICPYCDTRVKVPKGGTEECPCCSSTLNDEGKVVD